jgi:ABC-2 type transport system ATP-binding protein
VSVLISSHILHDLEALCADFILLRWGRIPRSLNEAASLDARARWPVATTFRCEAPEKLARFLFDRDLLRGCDIAPDTGTLHARWREPEKFFSAYHQLLLESGVRIFEVQDTESVLEKAIDPTVHS